MCGVLNGPFHNVATFPGPSTSALAQEDAVEGEEDDMEVADEDELDSEETVSFHGDQGTDTEQEEDDDDVSRVYCTRTLCLDCG